MNLNFNDKKILEYFSLFPKNISYISVFNPLYRDI